MAGVCPPHITVDHSRPEIKSEIPCVFTLWHDRFFVLYMELWKPIMAGPDLVVSDEDDVVLRALIFFREAQLVDILGQ